MTSPLRLPAEAMRALGYAAVDEVVAHLTTLRDRAVGRSHTRAELAKMFLADLPEAPSPAAKVLAETAQALKDSVTHTDHPRFLAYVPGPSNFMGALGDFLASGLNVHTSAWVLGAGAARVEEVVVGWLRDLCGLPESGGGIFVSGGTMASLVAIHAARVARPEADLVYVSTQTHASIRRGLAFLGIHPDWIRTVAVDREHRLDPADLVARIAADRGGDRQPLCVIATAGTTNTGAVDPLEAIAGVCQRAGAWLHVDGAYGAAAVVTPRGKALLRGLERANSIALDPHKWWFQPYEAGCVLVRDASTLTRAYSLSAEYLTETRLGDQPLNFYDRGPQLTRGFRALKVWLTLRTFGLTALRDAVEHGITLAEHAQAILERHPGWEVVTPAQLGVITFRPHRAELTPAQLDSLVRATAAATLDDGHCMLITTEIGGRPALRMCTIHPELTPAQLDTVIERLDTLIQG